jgi:hypothetical protein
MGNQKKKIGNHIYACSKQIKPQHKKLAGDPATHATESSLKRRKNRASYNVARQDSPKET